MSAQDLRNEAAVQFSIAEKELALATWRLYYADGAESTLAECASSYNAARSILLERCER